MTLNSLQTGRIPILNVEDPPTSSRPMVLRVIAWSDPAVEAHGIDPLSTYVEMFWLPVLGPSATWLVRRLSEGLACHPGGFNLDLDETARALGLGGIGNRNSPFQRALLRCARHAIIRHCGPEVVSVRRKLSAVPRRHVLRFPPDLRRLHAEWEEVEGQPGDFETVRSRARRLALDLVGIEESVDSIARRLLSCGVHPTLATDAARWASTLHREAGLITDRPELGTSPAVT